MLNLNILQTTFSNENKATFCNKPQVLLQRGHFFYISKTVFHLRLFFYTVTAIMTDVLQNNFSVPRLTC